MDTHAQQPLVIIGEDNPEMLALMQLALRDAAFEVQTANTGEGVMGLYHFALRSNRPAALLVVDGMMPLLTGYAVAERIRDEGDWKTPIIMLTQQDDLLDEPRGRAAGIVEFWFKENDLLNLKDKISHVLAAMPVLIRSQTAG